MKKINKKDILGFKVSYPSIKEQIAIIKKLDELYQKISKLRSRYERKIKDLDELEESLFKKIFSH